MDPLLVGLASAVFGGVGLKIVEYYLMKRKTQIDGDVTLEVKKLDDAVLIRQELRKEVADLKIEMGELYKKLDVSRDRYFELQQKYGELHTDYVELKQNHDDLKREHDKLQKAFNKSNNVST